MLTYLNRLAHYNLWANTQLVNYWRQAPGEKLMEHVESSFPSVRQTVLHIWGAEKVWYNRLQGHSPSDSEGPSGDSGPEIALSGLIEQSMAMQRYVAHLTVASIAESVEYRLFSGSPMRNTRAEMLQHCFNHSTYHRGQLVMFARQLGLGAPPSTDLIRYFRAHPAS